MRLYAILTCLCASAWMSPATAEDPDAWKIYLAARTRAGGGDAPGRLQDYSYDIALTLPAGEQEIEIRGAVVALLPDLIRQELQTPQGPTQLVFDGGDAWQVLGGKRRELPTEAAALQAAELARRHVLFGPLPDQRLVRYRREEVHNGQTVDVIEIIDVGGAPLRLYVGRDSKDVLKHVYVGDIPGGGMAHVEETFSEFVEIKGFRFASRREVFRNGASARKSALSGIRANEGLRREIVLP